MTKPVTFAARLKALRQEAGLTVTTLAQRAGMGRTHLTDLEAGRRQPSLRLAAKVAKALSVSLTVFDDLSP